MTIGGGVLRRMRGSESDDAGAALVLVVGSMLVLAMLALTSLAFVVSSQRFARYDQDYSSAMAAAQSGVEDYITQLNRNGDYYLPDLLDCANPALQGPMSVSNPCGWTTSTPVGWRPVDATRTSEMDAFFHYSADPEVNDSEGVLMLTVTGRANGEYRTIEVAVGKTGSTDFVYWTDFESADPTNKQAYPSGTTTACGAAGYLAAKYWWQGRSSEGCKEITFVSGDVLDGAVYSNDSIWSAGAHFNAGFTSLNPQCKSVTASVSTWNSCLRNSGGSSSTADFNGNQPKYPDDGKLDLTDTSAAFAGFPGCHYFGSTRVIFNSNGTMTVWNKTANSGGLAPVAIAGSNGVAPSCGSVSDLNSGGGATVPVPNGQVIYVAQGGGVNAQCTAGQIGGPAGYGLPLGTYTGAAPTGNGQSYTFDMNMTETTKFCDVGNLYVEGVLDGRVTVAASQSVMVTGDLVLAAGLQNGSNDMLGLVATNSVEVLHPWMATKSSVWTGSKYAWGTTATAVGSNVAGWPRQYNDPTGQTSVTGVQIMGSIQTLLHSFLVQKYDVGAALGTLQVDGSIAQRWRGIVGTGNGVTGYLKKYVYDKRLIYAQPPYFPRWLNAEWTQRYFGEINTPTELRS